MEHPDVTAATAPIEFYGIDELVAGMEEQGPRVYSLWYTAEWAAFVLGELRSVLAMYGHNPAECILSERFHPGFPVVFVRLSSDEEMAKVASRLAQVQTVMEVWSWQKGLPEAAAAAASRPAWLVQAPFADDRSWGMTVRGVHHKMSFADQEAVRAVLVEARGAPIPGRVKIRNPDSHVTIYACKPHPHTMLDDNGQQVTPEESAVAFDPTGFCAVLVGRIIPAASGFREAMQKRFDLRKRRYLGPTSLNVTLSVIMANMGHAQPGSFVIDPFVGTASLPLICTALGAICAGGDIDPRVIVQGKAGRTPISNFEQLKLPVPDILRMDSKRMPFRQTSPALTGSAGSLDGWSAGLFDAIVCDPPYGWRAGARTVDKADGEGVEDEEAAEGGDPAGQEQASAAAGASADAGASAASAAPRGPAPPSTSVYDSRRIFVDLLLTAARGLALGGRLVYLYPATSRFVPDELPGHPCLSLVGWAPQQLTIASARVCVTMEKTRPFEHGKDDEYMAQILAEETRKAASYEVDVPPMVRSERIRAAAIQEATSVKLGGPGASTAAEVARVRAQLARDVVGGPDKAKCAEAGEAAPAAAAEVAGEGDDEAMAEGDKQLSKRRLKLLQSKKRKKDVRMARKAALRGQAAAAAAAGHNSELPSGGDPKRQRMEEGGPAGCGVEAPMSRRALRRQRRKERDDRDAARRKADAEGSWISRVKYTPWHESLAGGSWDVSSAESAPRAQPGDAPPAPVPEELKIDFTQWS